MSSAIDPSKLKVVELRNELQERGLDTKGNKAALVQRLKEALEKETNTSIPDTSILETSTEDLDASQNEDAEDESSTKDKSSEDKMDVDSTENPAPKTSESSKTPEKSQADSANKVNQSPAKPQDSKSSEEKTESEAAQNGEQAVADKDDKGEDQTKDKTTEEGGAEQKGAKRKREGNSPDREGGQKVVRAKSPIKEDEPVIDAENVQLNWYDSDLHLQVNKENFLSAKPFTDGAFGYAWAGVRASHGVSKGKVCFEVKISEEITWEDLTKIAERRQDSRRNQKRDRDKKGRKNDDKKAGEKKADEKEDKDKAAKPEENTEVKKETTENGEKEDGATTESTETKAEPTEKKPEEMDTSTTEETKPAAEEAPMETNTSETAEGEKKPEEAVKKEGETKEGEDKEAEKDAEPEKKEPEEPPLPIHLVRIGWSLLSSSLQLGEDKCSYAYESTGKFVNDKQFIDYGKTFAVGDVVGAYLSIDDEYVTIRYTVNGELQPVAATLQRSEFPEEFALFPHVLTRNCAFEMNLGQKEEPWFAAPDLMKEYVFLTEADDKINGPTRPETRGDCEVILMCGLPGSGKTHWVKEHIGSNIDKRYTVIGNSSLLERMTVAGNPLRTKFKGKWSIFVDRLQKCLNALITLASQRRRNYIIDQTNVFPSAQRRKMRPFEGFKRKAVIVVVGDEEQTKRQALQESTDGKGVPDSVILEMKAAMSLPETGDWMDEVVYAGLDEAATKEQVKKYNEAGKSAGYGTEKRFRGDRFRGKRNDFRGKGGGDRRFPDRRFERRGGRGPRGGGGGRGGAGGGGGWRDRQDRRGPPPSRDYRGRGGGRDYGGRDFTRRDSGGFNRNRNLDRSGGGRWSGGGGGRSSGGWSSGGGGGGGWSQQSYGSGTGGYGNWGGQGGGGQWKYGGGGGQQGYGGGYGGRQGGGGGGAWDYYGQYGANQNWNSHDYENSDISMSPQQNDATDLYEFWTEYARYHNQQAQGRSKKFSK